MGVTVQETYSDHKPPPTDITSQAAAITGAVGVATFQPDLNVLHVAAYNASSYKQHLDNTDTVYINGTGNQHHMDVRNMPMYDTGSPLDIQSNLHNMNGAIHVVPEGKYPGIGSFSAKNGAIAQILIEGDRTEVWETNRGPREHQIHMLVYGTHGDKLDGPPVGYTLLSAQTVSRLGISIKVPRSNAPDAVRCTGVYKDNAVINLSHIGGHYYMPPAMRPSLSVTPNSIDELAAMHLDSWDDVYVSVSTRPYTRQLYFSATPITLASIAEANSKGNSNSPEQFPELPTPSKSVDNNLLKWARRFGCIGPRQVAKILTRAGMPLGHKGNEFAELYMKAVGKTRTSSTYRKKPTPVDKQTETTRVPSAAKILRETKLHTPWKVYGTDTVGPFPTSLNGMNYLAMITSGNGIKYYPKHGNTAAVHLECFKKFQIDFNTTLKCEPQLNQGVRITVDQGSELKGEFSKAVTDWGIKIDLLGRYSSGRYDNEGPHQVFARIRQALWRINRDQFLAAGYTYEKIWDHIALAANQHLLLLPSMSDPNKTKYEVLHHVDLDSDTLERNWPANIGDLCSVTQPKSARKSKNKSNKTYRRNGEVGELSPTNTLALYLRIRDSNPITGHNVHEVLVPGQGVMTVGINHIKFYDQTNRPPMMYDADDPLTLSDLEQDVKQMKAARSRANKALRKLDTSSAEEASTDDDMPLSKQNPTEFTGQDANTQDDDDDELELVIRSEEDDDDELELVIRSDEDDDDKHNELELELRSDDDDEDEFEQTDDDDKYDELEVVINTLRERRLNKKGPEYAESQSESESDSDDEDWYDARDHSDDEENISPPMTFDSAVGAIPLPKPREPRWKRRQRYLKQRNKKWDPREGLPRNDAAYDGLMAVLETIIYLATGTTPWQKIKAHDMFIPRSVPEALRSQWGEQWHKAMEYEQKKHRENDVFEDLLFKEAVQKYGKRRVHHCKYVYKVKPDKLGFSTRFRARFCVQGHRMLQGWDYYASFAAVPRPGSWKILLAIAAELKLCVKLIDVESAFLNSDLEEKEYVFIRMPEGVRFSTAVPPDDPRRKRKPPTEPYEDEIISVAKKALNGSPASPRAWAKRLHNFFMNNTSFTFTRSWHDPCCYIGKLKASTSTNPFSCLVLFWVDDILCVTYTKEEMDLLIRSFEGELPITVSNLDQYLGMQCEHDQATGAIKVNNNELIDKTAKLLGLDPEHSNGVNLPFEAGIRLSKDDCPTTPAEKADQAKWASDYRTGVGVLLWIATMTRHDCAYSASQLSRFVSNPGKAHFKRLKQTFRYLLKTKHIQLEFKSSNNGNLVHGAPPTEPLTLIAASDATWGTEEDGAFYCGWLLQFGGTPIIARSKKWKSAAISSTESEIIAMSECCRDIRNVRGFLEELGFKQNQPTTLWADNSSAIINGEEPTRTSDKTKHIRIRDFFCRECVANEEVILQKANGNFLSADALTKALAGTKFTLFRPILQGTSTAADQEANKVHVQCIVHKHNLQWNSPPCYCHISGKSKQNNPDKLKHQEASRCCTAPIQVKIQDQHQHIK